MKVSSVFVGLSVLMFSCNNRSDSTKGGADINQLISHRATETFENDKAFIIEAVDRSYNFIEIAEIAQLKGSQVTSSQATALKDGQISILYHLIDYADMKSIELPESNSINEAAKILYGNNPDFDENWHQEVNAQNEEMIRTFEGFRSRDKHLAKLITEVLHTLRFNRTVLDDYIAESN